MYTTLPSGMETTIKLAVGDSFVTGVVFGCVDFPHRQKLGFSFSGNGILLFDRESQKRIAVGSLS